MKFYLFTLSILFFIQTQAQQVKIETSRMHGLLVFVYSNMDRRSYSPYLKEFTDQSEYKDKVKLILSDTQSIERGLNQGTNYAESVKGYGDGFTAESIFENQSAYAKDIDDLFTRTQGLLPLEDELKFKKIVKAMEPIYEKLIWSPNSSKLSEMERKYNDYSKKWNLNDLFLKATKFYNTEWPQDQEFFITFYPIPAGAHHSNAHCLGAFASVGVIIDEKDHASRFGVVFHEMMHSLYSAQPMEFKKQLLSYYELENKDKDMPYRAGAQKFVNEVLATVLGNGWFYEVAAGKVDESSWYNEKHIRTMAQAMFDLTKSYLTQNKKIDKDYINQYIQEFKKAFPNYPEEKDYIFRDTDVVHTGKSFENQDIRKAFRALDIRSSSVGMMRDSSLLTGKTDIDKEKTNLFLLSTDEAKKITVYFKNKIGLPEKIYSQILKGHTGLWKWLDKDKNIRAISVLKKEDVSTLFIQTFRNDTHP